MKKYTSLLIFLLLVSLNLYAQQYKFKNYKFLDGLSQDFVYTINQDKNGYLWIGTGEGLSKFNGTSFQNFSTNDGLAEAVITSSFVDSEGKIYYGHNEGGISIVESNTVKSLKQFTKSKSSIKGISAINGNIFFITQNDGLYLLTDKNKLEVVYDNKNISYNNLINYNDSIVMVGTSNGVYAFSFTKNKTNLIDHLHEGKNVSAMVYSENQKCALLGLTGDGVVRIRLMEDAFKTSYWSSSFDLSSYAISTLCVDRNENLWIGTLGNGLIKIAINDINQKEESTVFNVQNGLQSDFIQQIYEDHEGNIWIGLFGAGISTLMDNYFVFYSHDDKTYGNNVHATVISGRDRWFGVENGLIHINGNLPQGFEFFNSKNGLIDGTITSLCEVLGNIWIGTESDGVFIYDTTKKKIEKFSWDLSSIEKNVNKIVYSEDKVWIATYGGLLMYDLITKEKFSFTTESGMPHNLIYTIAADPDGTILIGTKSNSLYKLKEGELTEVNLVEFGQLNIVDIVVDRKKRIWISTLENGVFKITNDTVENIKMLNGLKSNYCYAIAEDKNGAIWVGHSGSVSKITDEEIKVFGQEHGIVHLINHRSMYRDQSGYLWIGTNLGAIKYDASQDLKNKTAPILNIIRVWIGDKEVDFSKKIELPYGEYRVKIEFVGISFKDPEAVMYKYKLEGFDADYSELSNTNSVLYGRITEGDFQFKIIACNGDGVCSKEFTGFHISISTPFWKKWWFFVACFLVIASIVFSYIQIRTRNLKKVQEYLEQQLIIKTKEVVDQKEKIEEINKDMTSSINYAERIQRSMLPSTDILSKNLPGSFVYYQPRDIVSGDFFFIKKIEHKIILVCGDCTGHGVPGAFMSFIGGITLRNIYRGQFADNCISPEKVLERLDMEVETILKQNSRSQNNAEDEFYRTRDGMDIIICEIDTEELTMKVASAMRPYLIRRNNGFMLEAGDRSSIGGGLLGNAKNFTLKTHQLQKGDHIYLFTDGITDQFGGPAGRKLKMTGLKDLIEIVEYENPESQKTKVISDFLVNWMDDKPQIDDILLIGVKI